MTDDIHDLCDERRILKSKKKQQYDLENVYREINSTIRKKMKKSKDDWIQCQCKYIDDNIRHRIHNKWAYETLRTLTNTTPISISIIEDINDIPLAEDSMILKRLTEYYNDLYNRHINPDISVLNSNANFNTYIEE